MKKAKVAAMTMVLLFMLSSLVTPAHAGESYFYTGTSSFSAEFYLIGGQYTLYLYAKRPVTGYVSPESKSCIFGGNLQRVWPTQDALSLGSGITISTLVPHKIGPAPLTMPAGLYRLFIAPLTDCDWHFSLESTNQNPAGVAPVQMYKTNKGSANLSATASVTDQVEFFAQYLGRETATKRKPRGRNPPLFCWRGLSPNKVADRSQKPLRLIYKRHVPTVGQDDELRAGDPFVHFLRHSWIALVVIANDDQRGNLDLRKLVDVFDFL